MKKVLVTGDKGYIGSALVPLLLKNNFAVKGIDIEYFTKNITVNSLNRYESLQKDIRNVNEKDLEDVEAIIHLSALSNDPMGEINSELTVEINAKSTIKLAKLAKKNGVRRFIFSSSCSIYGIGKEDIVNENSAVNPLTAYAKSKIESEKELVKLASNDFCVGIMRNSTVYGFAPKFRNDLVVNNLATTALAYGEIRIMSDGTPWRPLIDVRDLSRIFIEFLTIDGEKINGEIINVGFDENNFQVKDIISVIQKFVPNCKVIYTGEHGKDTRSYKVSFKKFKNIFPSIEQQWPLEKSIKDLVNTLQKAHFGKEEFESGAYTRLAVLKKLINSGEVDQNLYRKDI